jgi:acyl dehydratase
MTRFDATQHRMVPEQRWFEDFWPGERFVLPSRTMTEAIFLAFQAVSGDNHPIHYDVEYCRARGMPGMLAHGLQTLIQTAAGAGLFPYLTEDSLIGFLDQSSRFLKPVFVGDTLYPALEVDELTRTDRLASWVWPALCTTSAARSCSKATSATCCAVARPRRANRDPQIAS